MTRRGFIKFLRQIMPFLLLLLAFYVDGILKYHLDFLNVKNNNGLPQIMLIVFVIMAFRMNEQRELIIYSVVFGVFYDIYYFGIFGIYTVLLPLMIYLVFFIKEVIPNIFLFELSVYVIILVVLHSTIFILGLIFGSATFNFIDYITFVLWPTLYFNVIAFIVLYLPSIFFVDKIDELRNEVI